MAIGMGGCGSEANIPLARAVVGGLLVSTVASGFVLPILYTLLIRKRKVEEIDIEAELADIGPHPQPLSPGE
jgi:Cu/Ag efflux pump CusA